jgi:hypothetical protein
MGIGASTSSRLPGSIHSFGVDPVAASWSARGRAGAPLLGPEPALLRVGPTSPLEVPARVTSLPGGSTSAPSFSTGTELHVGLLHGRLV